MLMKIMRNIKNNFILYFCLTLLVLFLIIRINSFKYSHDTTHLLDILHNILFYQTAFSHTAGIHRFNVHFSPILYILSPLYFLGPSLVIFLWKFFCFGLFLYFFWRLICFKNGISDRAKQIFLLIVALHPTFICNLIDPNIWDSDLNLPFLGLAIFLLVKHKYFLSLSAFACTFLVKEDMILVGILYGIMLTIFTKNRQYLWFSLASFLLFWVVTLYVMPSFAQPTTKAIPDLLHQNYGHLGNSFGEIFFNILKNPFILLKSGFWGRKLISIIIIFAGVGFLPWMRWSALIFLIPGLVILGYSAISSEPFLDYSKHYMLVFYVFTVWSALSVYPLISLRNRQKAISIALVTSVSVVLILQIYIRSWSFYFFPEPNVNSLKKAAKLIPPRSYMLTGGVGSPWVTYYQKPELDIIFAPARIEQRQYAYILINKRTIFWEVLKENDSTLKDNLIKLNLNTNYQLMFNENDVVLLKRNLLIKTGSAQPNWSENLTDFQSINQVQMKPKLLRELRFW